MSNRARRAEFIRVWLCPDCENVHVTLSDSRERPVAYGIVDPAAWDAIVTDIASRRLAVSANDAVGKPQGHA